MATIVLKDYGRVISESHVGKAIYADIESQLNKNGSISIDFTDIVSMATFCARQIFGTLYMKYGQVEFVSKLSLENANDSVKAVISEAIRYSVKHGTKNV